MTEFQEYAMAHAFERATDLGPRSFRATPDGVSIGLSVNK